MAKKSHGHFLIVNVRLILLKLSHIFKICIFFWLLMLFDDIKASIFHAVLAAGADPGFPVGGLGPTLGGRGPPTRALFGESVKRKHWVP